MTSDSTPLLFAITTSGRGRRSTNNVSWNIFFSDSLLSLNSISCGDSVTSSAGYIYMNDSNNKIYYSNNLGYQNLQLSKLSTTVPCGKVICAYESPSKVMTFSGSIIYYSTDGGVSYSSNDVSGTITDIICSYDGTKVAFIDSLNDIFLSTTGPGGIFNVMGGYPSGVSWNSISGSGDLLAMLLNPVSDFIYYYDEAEVYNYNATIPGIFGGSIMISLSLTINVSDGISLIIIASGSINYMGTTTVTAGLVTNIEIINPGEYSGNDNILADRIDSPYFSVNGFAFVDNTNSINYLIKNDLGTEILTNSFESGNFEFSSETLFLACLLSNTEILIKEMTYKPFEDLMINDVIILKKVEYKIEEINYPNILLKKIEGNILVEYKIEEINFSKEIENKKNNKIIKNNTSNFTLIKDLKNETFKSKKINNFTLEKNTKILVKEIKYKLITELKKGDTIVSEGKEHKIEKIIISTFTDEKDYPFLIKKGSMIDNNLCNKDLYLSRGHAIKVGKEFKFPKKIGFMQTNDENLEGLEKKYYHIKLFFKGNENRRTNTLTANGIIVESYGV